MLIFEGSGAVGIGGNQEDKGKCKLNPGTICGANGDCTAMNDSCVKAINSGAVYVFVRDADTAEWSQQAYIKASNTGDNDFFGWSLSMSDDGSILAVGASGEDSNGTGVNPQNKQDDNSAGSSGAVYIFVRDTATKAWSQQAYIKASNATGSNFFWHFVKYER